jgi:predicted  nucleic acid-binding Zn-ribbon protein
LKELTRTIAGYKRTITDLEKKVAEVDVSCQRRHVDDQSPKDVLEQATLKEQLSATESELAILRRRDNERESELSRLRDLVRGISNGNIADSV